MKVLIFVLVSIAACNAVNFRFLPRSILKAPSNGFGCAAGDTGAKCHNCTVYAFCANGQVDEQINCPSSTPFCDPYRKECVNTDTCNMPTVQDSELKCMRKGFFPHPSEANKFIYCSAADSSKGVEYTCPMGSNYDIYKKVCTTETVYAANFTANGLCKNQVFKIVVHPLDKSIYSRCSVAPKPITVQMCSSENYVMNPETRECEFQCLREGFFPNLNPANNPEKKFFVCIKDKTSFKPIEQECADSTTFKPDKEFCL